MPASSSPPWRPTTSIRERQPVEEREGHAGAGHAVVGLDVLGEVLGQDADPVTRRSKRRQAVGQPVGPPEEVAERRAAGRRRPGPPGRERDRRSVAGCRRSARCAPCGRPGAPPAHGACRPSSPDMRRADASMIGRGSETVGDDEGHGVGAEQVPAQRAAALDRADDGVGDDVGRRGEPTGAPEHAVGPLVGRPVGRVLDTRPPACRLVGAASIPVRKKPGSTIDTFTPKPATSMRKTSDRPSSPNFEAWYQPFSGVTAARARTSTTP